MGGYMRSERRQRRGRGQGSRAHRSIDSVRSIDPGTRCDPGVRSPGAHLSHGVRVLPQALRPAGLDSPHPPLELVIVLTELRKPLPSSLHNSPRQRAVSAAAEMRKSARLLRPVRVIATAPVLLLLAILLRVHVTDALRYASAGQRGDKQGRRDAQG